MQLSLYWRLARFHKPVGIILLWAPTAWALWLANKGHPPLSLILYFFLGTLCMRAAGCVVNDIADRHFDLHVQRTATRPLTSGALSVKKALIFLGLLLGLALVILLQLPKACFNYALIALALTVIYPFCKRFLKAPQAVLGLAFSMSIPMVYVASAVAFDWVMGLLLMINWLWVLAYDTQYAMADKAEDALIGIHSTALWFGKHDRLVVSLLQSVFHASWLLLVMALKLPVAFYMAWVIGGALLVYQHKQPDLQAFTLNLWYGMVMWGWMFVI